MKYIIDSNIWIDFFTKRTRADAITKLLTDNDAVTNDVILAELLPSAKKNKEFELIECLSGIEIIPLAIDWGEIVNIQYDCLRSGINKLGLLDIVIGQNAKQNGFGIFSIDRHMEQLSLKMGFELYHI